MAIGSATQRSALFARQQPGGFWVVADIEQTPEGVWFVDSGNGTVNPHRNRPLPGAAPLAKYTVWIVVLAIKS